VVIFAAVVSNTPTTFSIATPAENFRDKLCNGGNNEKK
jgi:hypothetical protein